MNVHNARTLGERGAPLECPRIKGLQHDRLKSAVDIGFYDIWSVDRHLTGLTEERLFLNALNLRGEGLCRHD